MMTDFVRVLKSSQQQVNLALEYYIRTFANLQTPLIKVMRHGTLLGGKRLRPFLVYQTGQLFGIPLTSLNAPAAAIECIHAYSLIHDDLPSMDNHTLRRGLPTCHIKFGETAAILAGDALQTLAFNILADAEIPNVSLQNRLKMISSLAAASGADGMCLGQALDLASKEQQVSTARLEIINKHKTGALIRAAVKMGILAAGKCGSSVVYSLDCFATAIGLAFQVQDDILDIVGDNEITGKKHGADQLMSKNTYPSLLGLKMARAKAQDLHNEALVSLKNVATHGYNTTMLVALAHYIIERNK